MTTQSKISQLPAAAVPLVGIEQVPLDQGNATVRVSVSALLAAVKAAGANGQVQVNSNGLLGAITDAELTALISTFTANASGAVPAPGAPSGKFLKDDGTWGVAGGGSVPKVYSWTFTVSGGGALISAASDPAIVAGQFTYLSPGEWLWDLSSLVTKGGYGASITTTDNGAGLPYATGAIMLGSGVIEFTNNQWSGASWAHSDNGDFSVIAILE